MGALCTRGPYTLSTTLFLRNIQRPADHRAQCLEWPVRPWTWSYWGTMIFLFTFGGPPRGRKQVLSLLVGKSGRHCVDWKLSYISEILGLVSFKMTLAAALWSGASFDSGTDLLQWSQLSGINEIAHEQPMWQLKVLAQYNFYKSVRIPIYCSYGVSVVEAVRRNPMSCRATDTEIAGAVKAWLKHAKDRQAHGQTRRRLPL